MSDFKSGIAALAPEAQTEWVRSRVDDLVDEVEALRQGLWDAGTISGMDTDGDTTPGGMDSEGLVKYILGEVKELREGYDEACETEHRLSGLLEQARPIVEFVAARQGAFAEHARALLAVELPPSPSGPGTGARAEHQPATYVCPDCGDRSASPAADPDCVYDGHRERVPAGAVSQDGAGARLTPSLTVEGNGMADDVRIIGPFKQRQLVVNDWTVPLVSVTELDGGRFSFVLDGRLGQTVGAESFEATARLLANVVACCWGYGAHPRVGDDPRKGFDQAARFARVPHASLWPSRVVEIGAIGDGPSSSEEVSDGA